MFIKQIYTNCLAESSYFIESDGEAIVIDPIREPDVYLELAKERNATVKYIFETHFHADFVSGHLELARLTNATIVFGPGAKPNFPYHAAVDGEKIPVGSIYFEVIHTPGHTPESSTFLLVDNLGKNYAIFTGDTLFIGDVGRPDLAITTNVTKEDLAMQLYDSLHNKILKLEDSVLVYPGHGAGSACGKNISKETFDTLGNQRKTNYALQPMSKTNFVELVSTGILKAPNYFGIAANINKNGYLSINEVFEGSIKPIALNDFLAKSSENGIILDTRHQDDFEKGHIPASINIGLGGQFAIWAATLLDYKTPIYLICDLGKEKESITRLARVGLDNVAGFLDGGFDTYKNAKLPISKVNSIEPEEISNYLKSGYELLDVRKPGEFAVGHIDVAQNIHLQELEENLNLIDKSKKYLIHCAGGYRSVIATSILQKSGFTNFVNVHKGWSGIQNLTDVKICEGVCATQQLRENLIK